MLKSENQNAKQRICPMAEGKDSGDLFSNSKLVVDATASVIQHKNTDNIDNKEVAGVAAEIMHAVSSYS